MRSVLLLLFIGACSNSVSIADGNVFDATIDSATDAPPDAANDITTAAEAALGCGTGPGGYWCPLHTCCLGYSLSAGVGLCFCGPDGGPEGCSGVGWFNYSDAGMPPPPDGGAIYHCDVSELFQGPFGCNTQTWCPLMWHQTWGVVNIGDYPQCVRIEQCLPIHCGPGYGGDCPGGYVCDTTSWTCVPPM